MAKSATYAYAISGRDVSVILYGENKLDLGDLRLRQETKYPWDGRIQITIEKAPPEEFSLKLRIPAWAKNAAATLNGKPLAEVLEPVSFFQIHRQWSADDVVELDLPMPVRLVEANPLVEESRNHVAVVRGPIVYCLEAADLPKDMRVSDVHLPAMLSLLRQWMRH